MCHFAELQEGHFVNDFAFFDSIIPNIFGCTPFLDIEPQHALAAEPSGLIDLSRMTPPSTSDRPVGPALQDSRTCSLTQNIASLLQGDAEPSVPDDPCSRKSQGVTFSCAPSHLQTVPTISEISNVDHERLLELCKSSSRFTVAR